MKVRVWTYDVDQAAATEFEKAYGDSGTWAALFARSPGYAGTELYRSVSTPGRYLTVDQFVDEAAWQQFLGEHHDDYQALDARTAALTKSEHELV